MKRISYFHKINYACLNVHLNLKQNMTKYCIKNIKISRRLHCADNPIYVFPEMKLHGLIHNSYIHVSVSDLYIPRIGLPIWLQQNRKILGIF
jgi:hypothetical protein